MRSLARYLVSFNSISIKFQTRLFVRTNCNINTVLRDDNDSNFVRKWNSKAITKNKRQNILIIIQITVYPIFLGSRTYAAFVTKFSSVKRIVLFISLLFNCVNNI